MRAGQQLVVLAVGGTMHVTCSRSRKGWTVCGRSVPSSPAERHKGEPDALQRLFHTRDHCLNCDRMKDAATS